MLAYQTRPSAHERSYSYRQAMLASICIDALAWNFQINGLHLRIPLYCAKNGHLFDAYTLTHIAGGEVMCAAPRRNTLKPCHDFMPDSDRIPGAADTRKGH